MGRKRRSARNRDATGSWFRSAPCASSSSAAVDKISARRPVHRQRDLPGPRASCRRADSAPECPRPVTRFTSAAAPPSPFDLPGTTTYILDQHARHQQGGRLCVLDTLRARPTDSSSATPVLRRWSPTVAAGSWYWRSRDRASNVAEHGDWGTSRGPNDHW